MCWHNNKLYSRSINVKIATGSKELKSYESLDPDPQHLFKAWPPPPHLIWVKTKLPLGQPRKRLTHVYDLCKGKKICEGGDEMDLNPDNPENAVNQVRGIFYI